jgi:hypothetical protein
MFVTSSWFFEEIKMVEEVLKSGVHFIKHDDIQGCIFKMCRNFIYEVVGQRKRLKAIKKNCSSKNKCHFIF